MVDEKSRARRGRKEGLGMRVERREKKGRVVRSERGTGKAAAPGRGRASGADLQF